MTHFDLDNGSMKPDSGVAKIQIEPLTWVLLGDDPHSAPSAESFRRRSLFFGLEAVNEKKPL
jgi:hypothetical protein